MTDPYRHSLEAVRRRIADLRAELDEVRRLQAARDLELANRSEAVNSMHDATVTRTAGQHFTVAMFAGFLVAVPAAMGTSPQYRGVALCLGWVVGSLPYLAWWIWKAAKRRALAREVAAAAERNKQDAPRVRVRAVPDEPSLDADPLEKAEARAAELDAEISEHRADIRARV